MSIFTLKRDTLERPSVFGEGDTLFRYNFASKYIKNKKVLDIGTGYGDGAHYLFIKGAKEVIGIDNSKMAIMEAKKKFPQKKLVFEIMDALQLRFPKNYFDVVVAFEILEHLPTKKHKVFLENIKRIKITGENKFPRLTINDFKIYRDKIKRDTCITLMATMKR